MDIYDVTTVHELAEFGKRMSDAMVKFKKAVERWWDVMESYGVTLEKLNEVSAAIADRTMTRREGWAYLGLPEEGCPS